MNVAVISQKIVRQDIFLKSKLRSKTEKLALSLRNLPIDWAVMCY